MREKKKKGEKGKRKKFLKEGKEERRREKGGEAAEEVKKREAFQAIVTSLTSDIISPILGIFGGFLFYPFPFPLNFACTRLIHPAGVSFDYEKVTDVYAQVAKSDFEKGYVVIKKGKTVYHKAILG